MKISGSLLLSGVLAAGSIAMTADAAEPKSYPSLQARPTYSVDVRKANVTRADVRKVYVNSCSSEGYECASGYSCDLIMTMGGEDAKGGTVGMSGTNQRFYSCRQSGVTSRPTCSKGLTPSGLFQSSIQGDLRGVPGAVTGYYCQIAL